MRTIAHLSDLHFGRADARIVDCLVATVAELEPDLVAVSGDLTQRARASQFREARAFLDRLPGPQIVVPGNHDVPLYDVFARFARPLAAFRQHITRELWPIYEDEEVAVIGANTTRSFTIKDGGLRQSDVSRMTAVLDRLRPDLLKVVVCHHPFDAPEGRLGRLTRPRPDAQAVATLVSRGTDVLLTGHLHVSYTGGSALRYQVSGRAAVIVEAGTAASTRVRGEVNSFNVLRFMPGTVTVERIEWSVKDQRFGPGRLQTFRRNQVGWAEDLSGGSLR